MWRKMLSFFSARTEKEADAKLAEIHKCQREIKHDLRNLKMEMEPLAEFIDDLMRQEGRGHG